MLSPPAPGPARPQSVARAVAAPSPRSHPIRQRQSPGAHALERTVVGVMLGGLGIGPPLLGVQRAPAPSTGCAAPPVPARPASNRLKPPNASQTWGVRPRVGLKGLATTTRGAGSGERLPSSPGTARRRPAPTGNSSHQASRSLRGVPAQTSFCVVWLSLPVHAGGWSVASVRGQRLGGISIPGCVHGAWGQGSSADIGPHRVEATIAELVF